MYGSKIDNLKLLKDNGINVPGFYVITEEDYKSGNYEDALKKCNDGLYAVRSSCNLEDGCNNSFAGQFDTYLNVKNRDLKDKISLCFASLHNHNVQEYIQNNHVKDSNIKMNVFIQKMVNSEISGVLFTGNPQGLLNESVIVVSRGLGENVVQDKGKVTSYYYNNTDHLYYYEGEDLLSKDTIENILNTASDIKNILGEYLDIEFAIEKDTLYILQARKITTIHDEHPTVLDNSNIVESYPNISSPMTISFVNLVYSNVFKRLVSRVLNNKKEEEKLNDVLNNMTSSCNGRIYYKISNWYALLKYLPFNSKIIPIWQDMMGVKVKESSSTKTDTSGFYKVKIVFNYVKELFSSQENMRKLNEEFLEIEKYYRNHASESLSIKELENLYKELENKVLNNWDITLINDMYAFIFTGLLKSHMKKKYGKDYEKITNDYISGISNIESLKPIKQLIQLAYTENRYSKDEFNNLKKDYIRLYGDRNLEELKLESKTFRTNPELLDEKIREYQRDPVKLENLYTEISKEKNRAYKEDRFTKFLIKRINSGIRNREISRLNRSRIYGIVREIVLRIGELLAKQDKIACKEDVFYLTIDEIFHIKENMNYKETVEKKKSECEQYRQLPAYSRLIFMDKEFNKTIKDANTRKIYRESDLLYGTPCSFGICEGEVLVVDNIHDIKDTEDKILVTKMTDPGWVFLIANAKGILSEKGSLLSHTAIISRELKIPSIVGAENLMEFVKTGDYIRMDANTGEIRRIRNGQLKDH